MLTKEENEMLEYLQAKKKRNHICVSCIHWNAPEPCWKANVPEVQMWLKMAGKYEDPELCCPEWYDEY